MIRSNGARAASSARIHAVGHREQQLAGAMAELHAIDRRIVARDVDRDRVDVGRDALRLGPQRQRGKSEQAGARADVGDIGEARAVALEPVERREAAAGGRMLAGAEGEAGVDLEIDRAGRRGAIHRRVDSRSGRRGSAAARPGSSSPNRPRRAARSAARRCQGWRSDASSSGGRLVLEIGMDQPVVGLRRVGLVGDQHRRASPSRERSSASAMASPCARVQANVTRKLTWPRLPSPGARRAAWSARGIVAARIGLVERRLAEREAVGHIARGRDAA